MQKTYSILVVAILVFTLALGALLYDVGATLARNHRARYTTQLPRPHVAGNPVVLGASH